MEQDRLFFVAPDSISLSAWFEHPGGWHLTVSHRTSGEPYDDGDRTDYSGLTSTELADVIEAEVSLRLGLI